MELKQIAQICHETNRAYCLAIGDHSQVPWDEAPEWQRKSAIDGVRHATDPTATPADSHNNWLREKRLEGWVYGEEKSVDRKEHPCMVPFEQLPEDQQRKDVLFLAVSRALL